MRVRNKTEAGVFVKGYGVVPSPAEDEDGEATVPQSDSVKSLIKADVLGEVKATSSGSGGSTSSDKES